MEDRGGGSIGPTGSPTIRKPRDARPLEAAQAGRHRWAREAEPPDDLGNGDAGGREQDDLRAEAAAARARLPKVDQHGALGRGQRPDEPAGNVRHPSSLLRDEAGKSWQETFR